MTIHQNANTTTNEVLTDNDLRTLVYLEQMTFAEASTYAWQRDNSNRAAERAAING
ncbi:hypothetical protein [Roseovarius sp. D22-M7]|uniref:hypothetical protein n=1 Tax=Roseovarius sp. D22-M7 TaxID=3127116 RepID=UPI0030104D48